MDGKELIERYRSWPRQYRMLAMVAAGLFWPVYVYTGDLPPLEEQLTATKNELADAQRKYEKVEQERKNLPKLEEELGFVKGQLLKAKSLLPEQLPVEDILQKTASIARETHVKLREFTPEAEQEIKGDYRYAEVPIALSISGGFGNIVGFYDRVVHLASNVRLRGMSFTPQRALTGAKDLPSTVEAKVKMVYFRSTDTGEAPPPAAEPPKKKFQSKKEEGEGGGAAAAE